MSQITTHILDTTKGRPVAGVTITLYHGQNDEWNEIGRSVTDAGGRAGDLLPNNTILPHGIYKMRFATKDYYDSISTKTFFPFIEVIFDITTNEHYHVPLLLNPYGYSTYRGS